MKITKISQQQKKTDWCSVFVDGKYSFSLPIDDIVEFSLNINTEVTEAQLDKYTKRSQDQKLYISAIDKLSRRAHSEFEIIDFLKRKQATPEAIDNIIKRLKKLHYLDDMAFAQTWLRNRRQLKNSSSRQIRNELYKKRVDNKIIDEVLNNSKQDENSALVEMIKKKKRLSRYSDEKKLIRYLAGKGFNYGDIKEALSLLED